LPLDPQFWSPDGSKVYLRLGFGTRMRTGPALFNDRRIWELDTATMTLIRLPDLPFDSMLSPSVGGDGRLYAIGFDRDDRGYLWAIDGEPFLSAVDLASGREVGRVPLPGLKLGADEELVTYEPAGVLDAASGRYYIAHAGTDAISVVDLTTWEVTTTHASARGQPALPSRLLSGLTSLFVSNAEAKGGGFHTREAALSPDGRLLLVSGVDHTSAAPDDPEDQTSASMPAGLRIIDTNTVQVLRFEDDIASFLIGDDGRFVFGAGCEHHFEHDWKPENCAGLKMLDLESMDLAAHIEPGRPYGSMALSLDGRYLHAASEGPGRTQMRKEGIDACDHPCIQVILDVIEIESLRVIATQDSETGALPLGR
jgi:hypothetical protein